MILKMHAPHILFKSFIKIFINAVSAFVPMQSRLSNYNFIPSPLKMFIKYPENNRKEEPLLSKGG